MSLYQSIPTKMRAPTPFLASQQAAPSDATTSEHVMLMLLAELNQKVDRILRLLSRDQTLDQAPHHVLPEKAVCAELSENGLKLIGYRRISPGDYLDLTIQFPEELSSGVRLLGQVVYEITFPSEERHQAGIVFTATHREDREQISRYVRLRQRRAQKSQGPV